MNIVEDVPWKAFSVTGLVVVFYSTLTFDFWDWLNTLVATAISVFAGVLLYRHQANKTAKELEDQLLTALAAEL